jgi:MFS family permease
LRNLDLAADARPVDRRVVITALGIAQILAWGTSFYFPAVFAEPIVAETGWSLGFVVGGTSIGLLTAGLISPQVGRASDVHGGRPVLLASSLFYATGLALVGFSPALPIYLAGWVLIGIGMGSGLYDDAVFAALGRMYGSEARGPITNLTLFGGFASTVCWPLSAFMIEQFGWRSACFIMRPFTCSSCSPCRLRWWAPCGKLKSTTPRQRLPLACQR